jgi:tetratricopeptide (TPR) repeat protein
MAVPEPAPTVQAAPVAAVQEPIAAPTVQAAPVAAVQEPIAAPRRPEPVPPSLPPAVSAGKPPLRAPKAKATVGLEDKLIEARQALAVGDYRRAATEYGAVIKRKYQLDEVTSELEVALHSNPKAAALWQVLGDAYMKGDRLPDAISAYERGMAAA